MSTCVAVVLSVWTCVAAWYDGERKYQGSCSVDR